MSKTEVGIVVLPGKQLNMSISDNDNIPFLDLEIYHSDVYRKAKKIFWKCVYIYVLFIFLYICLEKVTVEGSII